MLHPRVSVCLVLSILAFTPPASQAQAAAACATPRVLVERFISADCAACWGDGKTPGGEALVLDWIVPGARGEDAPLATAAIADGRPRAGAVSAIRTRERRHALASSGEWDVLVEDGPAWNGYIAAQVHVARQLEPEAVRNVGSTNAANSGAVAYLALVEQVRAGEEGTHVDRMLVRGIAGPLPLEPGEAVVTHLRAFRIPQGSKPARLTAVGWVEMPGGAVIAAARVEPDDCMPAR